MTVLPATTSPSDTVEADPDGDSTHIDVRLLVAPSAGRFRPVAADTAPLEGDPVDEGTLIGHVLSAGQHRPVRSFCSGVLVELLAGPDDQVRLGQPLAWVRPAGA